MKLLKLPLVVFAPLLLEAGEFVNLNFDNPDLSRVILEPTGQKHGPAEDLLRGWDVFVRRPAEMWQPYEGDTELTQGVAILTPVALTTGFEFGPYGVSFGYLVHPWPDTTPPQEIMLRTTGTVPLNAEAFEWRSFGGNVSLVVNGDMWGVFPGTQNSIDVRRFAGQEATFEFSVVSGGINILDVVGFKTVPEPSTWALLGTGLAAVLWFSRRR